MNKNTLISFIEWLEEEKNVYLVDLYYYGKDGSGMFDSLDDVHKLIDQFIEGSK